MKTAQHVSLIIFLTLALLAPDKINAATVTPENMVFIEGGCFLMGDTLEDRGAAREEKPTHRVCLDSFFMDKYEVTNFEYERLNPDFKKSRDAVYEGKKVSPGDRNPVVNVSWDAAEKYCRSIEKRLPTEAEWEFAARERGKSVRFGNGKNRISRTDANFDPRREYEYSLKGEFRGQTTPVGDFPPNSLGLYDMAGNVLEWVADWLDWDYYAKSPENNPKGPNEGLYRVVRGGSWFFQAYYLRTTYRWIFLIWQNGDNDVGFRCAR